MENNDLRGTTCDQFIVTLSKRLLALKPGESISIIADKDRIFCMHMVLKNSPRFIYKADTKEAYAEITIKRLR
ncbi:hypothetical protein HS7_07310 [Sulfolobales archaeon HS-7]|nr:hypothetical protein HS7_07310 [Sulfolobales archaeon HS-7]